MIADEDLFRIEDRSRRLVHLALVLPCGQLDDPPGKEGLAWMTGQMLLRGAAELDQAAIAEELDVLGSTLNVTVGRECTILSGDALTRNLERLETLIAKVLAEPTFPQAELDKLHRQAVAELDHVRDHDPALGQRFFVNRLFRNHPYGRPLKGTEASLDRITRDDVVAFHRDRYRQAGALAGGTGDLDRQRLRTLVDGTLGRLPEGEVAERNLPQAPHPEGYRLTLVDKPERTQTQIFLGHPMDLDAGDPDAVPLMVANTLFGGTFTARLNQEIRDKRGWSYGAFSMLHTDRRQGAFLMRFFPSSEYAVPAMKLTDELLTNLVRDGATDGEVRAAKSYLVHSHPMSIETPERELHERITARLQGHADDWVDNLPSRVEAASPEAVGRAVRQHLTPERLVGAIVCTAEDLRSDLQQWSRVDALDVVDYRTSWDEDAP